MLIGRDDELAAAIQHLADGTDIVLVGDAGVGKTSLAEQVLAGHRVVVAQCFQLLSWSAGLPLQRAVKRPIPAGDPTWTAHWLADHLPTGTVLRVEDAQWADPLTRDVLSRLIDVRVVATVRSGEPETEASIDALVGSGAARIDLEPLDAGAAAELAARRHPRLSPAEAAGLARRCGGNPLLIEEVADDATPGAGLRRAVTRRLQRLDDAARGAFAQIVLAGEPVPVAWFEETDALRTAGLVHVADASVIPRHPLLAEAAGVELADETVSAAAQLAERASAAGRLPLAARAFAAGGERQRALDLAVRAAEQTERSDERAGLLRLAVACAPAGGARDLVVRAMEELVAAGDYTQAAELIAELPGDTDAHWLVLVGRVQWQVGDDAAALAAFERALGDVDATAADRLTAQCEYARAVVLGLGDATRGLDLADAAYAAAVAAGVEVPRALGVLGTVENQAGRAGYIEHLSEAITLARESGDVLVELTSANNLVACHETDGNGPEACRLADEYAERAGALRLGAWQQQMQAMAFNARMHLGDYDRVLAEAPELLTRAADRRTHDQLEVTLNLVLVDTGRGVDVAERTQQAMRESADDHYGRGNLSWVRSEALLWTGDYAAAVAEAEHAVEHLPPNSTLFALLTAAHARARLGLPDVERVWPASVLPMLAAAPVERAALAAQVAGDRGEASTLFAQAAQMWAPHHRRGELRCRWLAAETEVDDASARSALLVLETELDERGWTPLLGLVRRSLRARGVRRAAPRGRSGELTVREREIIDLVAQGLSTNEIAARLSLSRATVAAQVASARARLGAATRWQAASGN